MSQPFTLFSPGRSLSLRGFDRRGATAAITAASSTGLTVSGEWSDQADFTVLVLMDENDLFGHLQTTKYLPASNLAGVTLDFDLSVSGCQNPASAKFQSVPWGALSYITSAEGSGTVALPAPTSTTGAVAASTSFTLVGTPTTYDRAQIVYLGNVVVELSVFGTPITTGQSLATVATNLAAAINAITSSTVPLSATAAGAVVTVTCTVPGFDGNGITLLSMYHATGNTQIYPTGAAGSPPPSGLTATLHGGADPTSQHYHLDFSALTAVTPLSGASFSTSCRQLWMTFAPQLQFSGAYIPSNFSVVFSGWTVVDPNGYTALSIAGPGSVTVPNSDTVWLKYAGSGWARGAGSYWAGFAQQADYAASPANSLTVKYPCQSAHSLYLGTDLYLDRGQVSVTVDGGSPVTIDCYADTGSVLPVRKLIAAGVAAGAHTVVVTILSTHNALSTGTAFTFDYLQAAVLSGVQPPVTTYAATGVAIDYDTDQTYKLAPARALWVPQTMGLTGDIDFYAGVFFALKRVRSGGSFHACAIQLAGTWGTGNSDGGGADTLWLTVGGLQVGQVGAWSPPNTNTGTVVSGATSTGGNPAGDGHLGGTVFGVAAYPADTLSTLAQRAVDAINGTFVGVWAETTGTPGQVVITVLSPINGFALDVSISAGAAGTIAVSGDIGTAGLRGGQEGTWAVDATQAQPLNAAFCAYLADLCGLLHAAGQTCTVAFSQELLMPPDVNTSAGAWTQRFANGVPVLTDTAFGTWGAGYVEAAGGSPDEITQTGHGYVTGMQVNFASGLASGSWLITVVDANHYTLTTQVSNSTGSYAPGVGDAIDAELQTSQCNFNPATFTAYSIDCFKQAAGIMNTAGLVPWLQCGEMGWWFFSILNGLAIGYASYTAPISIGTNVAHGLASGEGVIVAGVEGDTAANGNDWAPITVTDATHFTLPGSSGNGAYVASTGTVTGGGMAYYDAYTLSAATAALGRSLAQFYTQNDDPSVNSYADANFLRGQVYAHIHAIVAAVKAAYSGAKMEWLLPTDVNSAAVYWNQGYPYPQGGRLNHYVNIPAQYTTPSADIDRIKTEAMSWGVSYFNMDLAVDSMLYGQVVYGYPWSAVAYIVPWFTGTVAWTMQYLLASQMALLCLWAIDHAVLFDWPVPPMPACSGSTHAS